MREEEIVKDFEILYFCLFALFLILYIMWIILISIFFSHVDQLIWDLLFLLLKKNPLALVKY